MIDYEQRKKWFPRDYNMNIASEEDRIKMLEEEVKEELQKEIIRPKGKGIKDTLYNRIK